MKIVFDMCRHTHAHHVRSVHSPTENCVWAHASNKICRLWNVIISIGWILLRFTERKVWTCATERRRKQNERKRNFLLQKCKVTNGKWQTSYIAYAYAIPIIISLFLSLRWIQLPCEMCYKLSYIFLRLLLCCHFTLLVSNNRICSGHWTPKRWEVKKKSVCVRACQLANAKMAYGVAFWILILVK